MNPQITFLFFGSSTMSIYVLDELEKAGYLPAAVVTTPDKHVGRKQVLTPTPVKAWAIKKNIPVFAPQKLDAHFADTLKNTKADLFIVASYGKIIPETVLSIPPQQTLNVHPSLLPKYRGASPLQSAILNDDKHTGVTIMKIDALMDHGPIVAQKEIFVSEWPTYGEFEEMMAREGGKLLAEILPHWVAGKITEKEQDHASATSCPKFTKEDGEIHLNDDDYLNFRKIQAFNEWPQAYFFIEHSPTGGSEGAHKKIRVKITRASFTDGKLDIQTVIPEGSKEMAYADFVRGYIKK